MDVFYVRPFFKSLWNLQKFLLSCICCQQGLKFELSDKTNPNFEQDTEITVVGTFDTYSDGKFLYCHLKNAKMIDE